MSSTSMGCPCPRPSRILLATLALMVACGVIDTANAQDNATWSADPGPSNNFNDPSNWVPSVVPTGTAFFGATSANGTAPLIFATTALEQITFTSSAPGYSIGVLGGTELEITGANGIVNDSANRQGIIVLSGGTLFFFNSTAGNSSIQYGNRGGTIYFQNSTAGGAIFENQNSGNIIFINGTAGSAVISNDVGPGTITFLFASTAGSATINNTTTGGGSVIFSGTSSAGNADITNFGASGIISFQSSSDAGSASINNNAGGVVNFQNNSTADQ